MRESPWKDNLAAGATRQYGRLSAVRVLGDERTQDLSIRQRKADAGMNILREHPGPT
jgi:hypothetical protein